MMFRGKSVLGSSLINTAAGLFSLAAGFSASVIVARLLGAEGTGIVAFALYIMILATAVADAGIPQTVLRFVAGSALDQTHRALFSVFTKRFVATTSLVAAGILGYALWLYAVGDGATALIWAATTVLFLAYAYSTLSLGVAHGLGQFGAAAKRTLIGCVVQPIAIAVGALVIGPAGAILGYALRHLPQAFAISKHLDAGQATQPPPITPAMRTYARYNWLSNALWVTLGSRAELVVIGFYFSFATVGYYAIGLTINGLVLQLCTFLLASLIPYFGSLHDSEDMPRLVLGYQRGLRWLGLVIAPICFGGAAIAPVLIPFVFGQAFEPAVGMAEILIVFSFAAALTSVPARMMMARQHSAQTLWVSVIWGGISIALMFAIVPHYGGLGAAWIKGAISVAILVSFIWYCRARLDIPFVAGDIVKIAVAGLLSAAAARLCIHYVPDLAGMGVGIAAGAVVYCGSVLLLSVLPADEKAQLGAWISSHSPARRPGSRVGDEVAEQDVS